MIPTDVKLHQVSGILEMSYGDGTTHYLSAEFLRINSPSAEVQGHSQEQAILQHGKKMVKIGDLIPQGHYALRIHFTDGHDSGIYTWEYLFDLGHNQADLWSEYLAQLKKAGKTREPQFIAISQ
ncbi:MAG: DUF971 family protein [Candidatus Azotimanducaceae bacterium]|jgi:DUF971 family protein